MELSIEPVDLHHLLQELEATMQPLLQARGNELSVDMMNAPSIIYADEMKLKQILLNLLGNANKFTSHGQLSLSAGIQIGKKNRKLEIIVADTGIGIEKKHRSRLFTPFSQADASTTRKYGGTGLGLAISRNYCRMMGGDLYYQQRDVPGSCFVVELPQRTAKDEAR